MKCYLAGPIDNCTDEEVHGWRESVKAHLPQLVYLDPSHEDFGGRDYREMLQGITTLRGKRALADYIVDDDLYQIRQSDVVFANCWKVSTGTLMELVYAQFYSVPTIVIVPHVLQASIWLIKHATYVYDTIEAGMDQLSYLFKDRYIQGKDHS